MFTGKNKIIDSKLNIVKLIHFKIMKELVFNKKPQK